MIPDPNEQRNIPLLTLGNQDKFSSSQIGDRFLVLYKKNKKNK